MPVVVLRLRGHTTLGATALTVLRHYARQLNALGGHLFLSGVDPGVVGVIRRTGRAEGEHSLEVVEATRVIGESTDTAHGEAQAWLAARTVGKTDA